MRWELETDQSCVVSSVQLTVEITTVTIWVAVGKGQSWDGTIGGMQETTMDGSTSTENTYGGYCVYCSNNMMVL